MRLTISFFCQLQEIIDACLRVLVAFVTLGYLFDPEVLLFRRKLHSTTDLVHLISTFVLAMILIINALTLVAVNAFFAADGAGNGAVAHALHALVVEVTIHGQVALLVCVGIHLINPLKILLIRRRNTVLHLIHLRKIILIQKCIRVAIILLIAAFIFEKALILFR